MPNVLGFQARQGAHVTSSDAAAIWRLVAKMRKAEGDHNGAARALRQAGFYTNTKKKART